MLIKNDMDLACCIVPVKQEIHKTFEEMLRSLTLLERMGQAEKYSSREKSLVRFIEGPFRCTLAKIVGMMMAILPAFTPLYIEMTMLWGHILRLEPRLSTEPW